MIRPLEKNNALESILRRLRKMDYFFNLVKIAFDRSDTTCIIKAHKRRSLVNYAK